MTQTRIRIGQVAIEGVARAAAADAFGKRLQTAIAAALRHAPVERHPAASLPYLRLTLRPGATEAEVASAVANALRDAIVRPR